jgi:hypothetical protein
MWLITTVGFFSIVQKPEDKRTGTLTIRARTRDDLEALRTQYLRSLGEIRESSYTDYRYRATVPKAAVAAAVAQMIEDIDYSNFKNEVARKQGGKRSHLYHEIWGVLYRMQAKEADYTGHFV